MTRENCVPARAIDWASFLQRGDKTHKTADRSKNWLRFVLKRYPLASFNAPAVETMLSGCAIANHSADLNQNVRLSEAFSTFLRLWTQKLLYGNGWKDLVGGFSCLLTSCLSWCSEYAQNLLRITFSRNPPSFIIYQTP